MLVSPAGVEPAAFPLGGGRSIQLSYGDLFHALHRALHYTCVRWFVRHVAIGGNIEARSASD